MKSRWRGFIQFRPQRLPSSLRERVFSRHKLLWLVSSDLSCIIISPTQIYRVRKIFASVAVDFTGNGSIEVLKSSQLIQPVLTTMIIFILRTAAYEMRVYAMRLSKQVIYYCRQLSVVASFSGIVYIRAWAILRRSKRKLGRCEESALEIAKSLQLRNTRIPGRQGAGSPFEKRQQGNGLKDEIEERYWAKHKAQKIAPNSPRYATVASY